jgi:hypothetical protein
MFSFSLEFQKPVWNNFKFIQLKINYPKPITVSLKIFILSLTQKISAEHE